MVDLDYLEAVRRLAGVAAMAVLLEPHVPVPCPRCRVLPGEHGYCSVCECDGYVMRNWPPYDDRWGSLLSCDKTGYVAAVDGGLGYLGE